MSMMTTYRLSLSLPLSRRCITLGVVLAYTSLAVAVENNHVLTAYDVDARLDDDVEVDSLLLRGLLLPLSNRLKHTTEGRLDRERLLCR